LLIFFRRLPPAQRAIFNDKKADPGSTGLSRHERVCARFEESSSAADNQLAIERIDVRQASGAIGTD